MRERIREALQFVSSDDREVWVEIGMAVKSALGHDGFDLWNEWSMQSSSYRPDSAKSVWRSIKQYGAITEGTLFHMAREAGWRDDGKEHRPSPEEIAERRRIAQKKLTEQERETERMRAKAAEKARWILGQCELDRHAYMDSKGFPEAMVNVWRRPDKDPVMVVPVYYRDALCGVQLISIRGEKMFLKGQRMDMGHLKIGSGRRVFLVEGYATAVSLKEMLHKASIQYTIYVCFSAGNLAKMAQVHREAFIFADNDLSGTGQRVAEESGLPWWMPPKVGQDLNDMHQELGTFKASMELKRVLMKKELTTNVT